MLDLPVAIFTARKRMNFINPLSGDSPRIYGNENFDLSNLSPEKSSNTRHTTIITSMSMVAPLVWVCCKPQPELIFVLNCHDPLEIVALAYTLVYCRRHAA